MTAQEYLAEVLRTYAGSSDRKEELTLAALGLTGEAGEVADHIKKALFSGHRIDSLHLLEELGDVLWYVALAAHAVDFTLNDVMEYNVQKLRKRYPNGFDPKRSINRSSVTEEENGPVTLEVNENTPPMEIVDL